MKRIGIIFICVCAVFFSYILGRHSVSARYRNHLNVYQECLFYASESVILFDSIVDSHADDGKWDMQVDELGESGYWNLLYNMDSTLNIINNFEDL